MSTYKIGVLQQALDESVPAAELEAANKQYNELTAKYRDIIQRENSLVARSAIVDNLEVRCGRQNHSLFCVSCLRENCVFGKARIKLHFSDLLKTYGLPTGWQEGAGRERSRAEEWDDFVKRTKPQLGTDGEWTLIKRWRRLHFCYVSFYLDKLFHRVGMPASKDR